MANRLKMVHKELLFTLFSQDWSIRKINVATGIHRKTISRYRDEWRRLQDEKARLDVESAANATTPEATTASSAISENSKTSIQNYTPVSKRLRAKRRKLILARARRLLRMVVIAGRGCLS